MAEPSKQRGRLTLSALQAIEVPDGTRARSEASTDAALEAPVATTPDGAEAAPDTAPVTAPVFRVEARDHLPDGVSREVASLLGMPSREELERAAAARAAAEKAAAEAAEQARRQAELEAERRRAADDIEQAQRQIQATQAAAAVQIDEAKKRSRLSLALAAAASLGLAIVAIWFASAPPELDTTPYASAPITSAPQANAEGSVGFMAIPPAPIIEAPQVPATTGRNRTGNRTQTVRGTELF